jgi:hypothetical protein
MDILFNRLLMYGPTFALIRVAQLLERTRDEHVFMAREKGEGSLWLASWLVAQPNNDLLHKILVKIVLVPNRRLYYII